MVNTRYESFYLLFLLKVTNLLQPNAMSLYLWLMARQHASFMSVTHTPWAVWNGPKTRV